MSLDDIIKSIQENTAKEIAKIKEQGQEKQAYIKADFEEKVDKRKKELLKEFQIEADRKVSQADFEAKSLINSKVLKAKQDMIEEVYKQALSQLSSLSDADVQKLLVKLIKSLPKLDKGEIIPASGSEAAVKKAASTTKTTYTVSNDTCKGKGGFKFVSAGLEINNTFEAVINNLKEQTETEVANTLF